MARPLRIRSGKNASDIDEQSTGLSSSGQTRKFPDFVVECLDKRTGRYEAAQVASYEAADCPTPNQRASRRLIS
jgi:hypothetical protein